MAGFEQFLVARLAQLREELLAEHTRWTTGCHGLKQEAPGQLSDILPLEAGHIFDLCEDDSVVPMAASSAAAVLGSRGCGGNGTALSCGPGLLVARKLSPQLGSPASSLRSLGNELEDVPVGPTQLPGQLHGEPAGVLQPDDAEVAKPIPNDGSISRGGSKRQQGEGNEENTALPLPGTLPVGRDSEAALEKAFSSGQPEDEDGSPMSARTVSKTSSEVRVMEWKKRRCEEKQKQVTACFTVLPVWEQDSEEWLTRSGSFGGKRKATHRVSLAHIEESVFEDIHAQSSSTVCPRMEQMMMKPASLKHTLWMQIGTLIGIYEMVIIPMAFFKVDELPLFLTINWFVRFYWLVDMVSSFFHGYYLSDGRLEMRPERVARHYLCSWFPLDITIIVFDWLDVWVRAHGLGSMRIWKSLKAFRLLRMLRYVKVASNFKIPDFLHNIMYQFHSEAFGIAFEIFRLTFFIAWVTHFVACCWWGIGDDMTGHSITWVTEHGLEDESLSYQYSTAFHWSLTQFTGSMEVFPVNVTERAFTDVVLLVGFLIGAWVVSLITASMTRLQMVTAHQATQVTALRQYLHDNCISSRLALRVQRHAKDALILEKKKTPEESIELLALISEPMRIELHYEIFKPALTEHPFLAKLETHDPSAFRRICHLAVTKMDFTRGDIIFCAGDQGHDTTSEKLVRFVTKGTLDYTQHGASSFIDTETHTVEVGSWISEHVLWTQWVHCGDLRTTSECTLLALSTLKFQEIAKRAQINNQPEHPVLNYARNFVKVLNKLERSELSDLDMPELPVWEITGKAFPRGSSASTYSSESDDALMKRAMFRRGVSRTQDFGSKRIARKSFNKSASRSRLF